MKTATLQPDNSYSRLFFLILLTAAFIFVWQGSAAAETLHRAASLLDRAVKNAEGAEIGEIDDLVLRRNGRIKQAILSVGGFLDIGDKDVVVSLSSLDISPEGKVTYDVTRDQLENHPTFDYDKRRLYRGYYAPHPYGSPYSYSSQRMYGRQRPGYLGPYQGWEYFPERVLVSIVLNRMLLNDYGQVVGTLDDLLFDDLGNVKKVVLSVGDYIAVEEKRVALPFQPLAVSYNSVYYHTTKEELKNAPAFHYPED